MDAILMRGITSGLILLTLISAPAVPGTELRDLLSPVTGQELVDTKERNDYFLKKHLHLAKNHRIVKVDEQVLLSDDEFKIELFDGDSMRVRTNAIDVKGDGFLITWTGVFSNPVMSLTDLEKYMGSEENAKLAYDAMYGIHIAGSRSEVDGTTGMNISIYTDNEQAMMRPEWRGSGNSSNWFYRWSGRLPGTGSGKLIRILSLEMGGPYHLLIEFDPSKMFRPVPPDHPDFTEMQRRQKNEIEFLDSLGEDPRKAILRDD